MKKLLLVLMLAGLLSAQSGSVVGTLSELEQSSQLSLGIAMLISLVISVPFCFVAVVLYLLAVRGKKKPGIWKTIVSFSAAIAMGGVLGAVLSAAIYALSAMM